LGLRFLAATATLTLYGQRIAFVLDEMHKQSSQSDVTKGDGLHKMWLRRDTARTYVAWRDAG